MALLTASDLLARYDARAIGQRVNDDGTSASAADIPTNARVVACLADAEAELMAAVAVGGKYAYADLQTAVTDATVSGNKIKRVLADLAFGLILKGRALPAAEFEQLAPAYAEAVAFLDLIRQGERVFQDVPGVVDAGIPETLDNVPRPGIDEPLLWSQNVRLFGNLDWQ